MDVSGKKCDDEWLLIVYDIILKDNIRYLNRWIKHVIWTKKWFPLILNGELENVLVCAQCFIKTSTSYLKFKFYYAVIYMFGII